MENPSLTHGPLIDILKDFAALWVYICDNFIRENGEDEQYCLFINLKYENFKNLVDVKNHMVHVGDFKFFDIEEIYCSTEFEPYGSIVSGSLKVTEKWVQTQESDRGRSMGSKDMSHDTPRTSREAFGGPLKTCQRRCISACSPLFTNFSEM